MEFSPTEVPVPYTDAELDELSVDPAVAFSHLEKTTRDPVTNINFPDVDQIKLDRMNEIIRVENEKNAASDLRANTLACRRALFVLSVVWGRAAMDDMINYKRETYYRGYRRTAADRTHRTGFEGLADRVIYSEERDRKLRSYEFAAGEILRASLRAPEYDLDSVEGLVQLLLARGEFTDDLHLPS